MSLSCQSLTNSCHRQLNYDALPWDFPTVPDGSVVIDTCRRTHGTQQEEEPHCGVVGSRLEVLFSQSVIDLTLPCSQSVLY